MEIFYVLPFGGALFARLRHRLWQAWLTWLSVSLVSFLAFLLFSDFSAEACVGIVCISSLVGFFIPELWQILRNLARNLRQSLIRFLSKPKNAVIVVFLLLFLYALHFQPKLLNSLIVLAIFLLLVYALYRFIRKGFK